jgi:type VII secretion protein EssA
MRMRKLWQRTSLIAALLLGIFPVFSLNAYGENATNNNGELRVKIERIGGDEIDLENLDPQDVEETELEKVAPGLFKEQTGAAIQSQQKEFNNAAQEFKESLFVSPVHQNTFIEDTGNALFSSDYEVEHYGAVGGNRREKSISIGVLAATFGLVFIICGGLYFVIRRYSFLK